MSKSDFGTETTRMCFHLGNIFCGHTLIETRLLISKYFYHLKLSNRFYHFNSTI